MSRECVGIYVWQGKAYLPVQARTELGVWMDTEPVYVADVTTEELLSAVQKILMAGHLQVPHPTREEWRRHKDPVLTATGARNWKELARTGASYSIRWNDEGIRVSMSRLDKDGKWEFDPEKLRVFPPNTALEDIVAVILEDVRLRAEVEQ
jgi:hypothetical protein